MYNLLWDEGKYNFWESLSLLCTWDIHKLTPTIGSSCFEMLKKKLSICYYRVGSEIEFRVSSHQCGSLLQFLENVSYTFLRLCSLIDQPGGSISTPVRGGSSFLSEPVPSLDTSFSSILSWSEALKHETNKKTIKNLFGLNHKVMEAQNQKICKIS